MNCQSARQAMMIDPQRLTSEASTHIAACDECRHFQSQTEKLDALTVHAIRQPARENLSQRVMAAQRLRAGQHRLVYSMAASLVAVAFALMWLSAKHTSNSSWGEVMAEHMEEDPLHNYEIDPLAMERLQRAMAEVGVTQRGEMPHVIRARVCPIGKEVSVHAVFEVNGARVVAFMVNRPMDAEALQHKQWHGELVRVQGGTVAVFSENDGAMKSVKAALMNSVGWRAV